MINSARERGRTRHLWPRRGYHLQTNNSHGNGSVLCGAEPYLSESSWSRDRYDQYLGKLAWGCGKQEKTDRTTPTWCRFVALPTPAMFGQGGAAPAGPSSFRKRYAGGQEENKGKLIKPLPRDVLLRFTDESLARSHHLRCYTPQKRKSVVLWEEKTKWRRYSSLSSVPAYLPGSCLGFWEEHEKLSVINYWSK